MKNPLLIPFLAILLTIFVVGFISKQEQNTDKSLFREYSSGFKQAKLPLKVKANNESFNDRNKIDSRFSKFLPEGMQYIRMSRKIFYITNEYLEKIIETNEIIVVLCGSLKSTKNDIVSGVNSYEKVLIVYDKKGIVLDSKRLAFEREQEAFTANISNDSIFYIKKFTKKDERKSEWKLEKTENFIINSAGKIEQKP